MGIIGATLGGGVSSLEGLHGLLIDTLVSVRLVTAAGNAITVSKTQNPDLFWALRGAGANFGVVTSATYNVFDATNGGQVTSANFEYFGAANQSIFGILKTLDEGLPANLAINVAVQYSPQYNQVSYPLLNSGNHFIDIRRADGEDDTYTVRIHCQCQLLRFPDRRSPLPPTLH